MSAFCNVEFTIFHTQPAALLFARCASAFCQLALLSGRFSRTGGHRAQRVAHRSGEVVSGVVWELFAFPVQPSRSGLLVYLRGGGEFADGQVALGFAARGALFGGDDDAGGLLCLGPASAFALCRAPLVSTVGFADRRAPFQ